MEASLKRVALITNVKRPRLITVMGRVRRRKIGLIKALMKARIITANRAESNPSSQILSNREAVRPRASALRRTRSTVR
jgi:hypothetical protein